MSLYRSVEHEFVERLGLAIEADGLPRIAGRILGFLVVNSGPCRAIDLMHELKVSHASISTNTRLLESLGVIERVTFPGDRNSYFQLLSDPYRSLLDGYIKRIRKVHGLVVDARNRLPQTNGEAGARLAKMERFYRLMLTSMESVAASLATDDPTAD